MQLRSSRFCPRMMFRIDTLQPVQSDMGINLRGRNVCVAEDGLHGAQVGTIFYHVRRAAVAQHVWAGVASRARGSKSNNLPDALARKFLHTAGDEQQW